MKKTILCLSALAASATLSAQTAATKPAPTHPTTHIGTTVHHSMIGGGCLTLPATPKISALEAGAPCPKALYTMTHTPESKADYISPLVSPAVKEGLDSGPTTFTLAYVDTTVGTGELVHAGKFLSVKYTGYLTDGTKFDSSEDHPGKEPIAFPYGQHRVIPGWDTGFEGMHVGGKRRLFIPFELAYGDAGKPPVIPAKSELIFDVEVVSQSDSQPAPAKPPTPTPHPAPPPPAEKPATPPADKSTTPPAGTTPPPTKQ